MAVMLETRTLHDRPNGNLAGKSLNIQVPKGTSVDVTEELPPRFVKVRAPAIDGSPEGWVLGRDVDRNTAGPLPINQNEFAKTAIADAAMFGVTAHLQMAVAHMLTGLADGKAANGVDTGPYAFSSVEWDTFSDRNEFGLTFVASDIDQWQAQSMVAAFRNMLLQDMLAEKLNRQPNAVEMALALMTGAKAASAAIRSPNQPMDAIVTSIDESDPETAGVDKANIPTRFGKFLKGKSAQQVLAGIEAALQASLDATRSHFSTGPGATAVGSAGDAMTPQDVVGNASVTINVTDEDLDALARVAKSEVGHFAKHGEDQLKGGLEAVVDTIFNRVAHKKFPNSIQAVINAPFQFSAINAIKTWKKLPPAPEKIFKIVSDRVAARIGGAPSIIGSATYFLNPFVSDPKPMRQWGNFVVAHAVAKFGNVAKEDVHFHGTAPGVAKPRDYVLKHGNLAAHFNADGEVIASGAAPAAPTIAAPALVGGQPIADRIVSLCLEEWEFFQRGKRKEEDDPQFRRIGDYWKIVGENFDGRSKIKGNKPGEFINPPWSSAFISFVVKTAGGGERFLYSQAHSNYVQDFVKGRPGGLYEAMRPENHAPAVGDIVHYGREGAKNFDFDAARQRFQADKRYSSHSDFVIAVDRAGGTITTIGGNVTQSVAKKTLKIQPNGTLKNRIEGGIERPWIAVLKCLG